MIKPVKNNRALKSTFIGLILFYFTLYFVDPSFSQEYDQINLDKDSYFQKSHQSRSRTSIGTARDRAAAISIATGQTNTGCAYTHTGDPPGPLTLDRRNPPVCGTPHQGLISCRIEYTCRPLNASERAEIAAREEQRRQQASADRQGAQEEQRRQQAAAAAQQRAAQERRAREEQERQQAEAERLRQEEEARLLAEAERAQREEENRLRREADEAERARREELARAGREALDRCNPERVVGCPSGSNLPYCCQSASKIDPLSARNIDPPCAEGSWPESA